MDESRIHMSTIGATQGAPRGGLGLAPLNPNGV